MVRVTIKKGYRYGDVHRSQLRYDVKKDGRVEGIFKQKAQAEKFARKLRKKSR